jgi:preprotein translocase subunit YajC
MCLGRKGMLLQQQQPPSSAVGFLITVLPIILIFYFLLFLPMQRQRKRQQKMLASLETGQTVLTSGGIIGTIVAINRDDDTLVLRVKPDNVKLQITRSAVAALIPSETRK